MCRECRVVQGGSVQDWEAECADSLQGPAGVLFRGTRT